ncbi:patatin-like phospholipase family protein [Peptostreptococcus equinus]|uniref:Patatin family protein n=1 Tax=Peptostreptococcus equinus TaxID=3003601 RepID=A0ABY7JU07_9FIRM|nr:patatin family protein [Peptostreptococcus sp. CBA3647]WAW15202.1 patatin family protein [Peptostreptococcus sp. CBA3647]
MDNLDVENIALIFEGGGMRCAFSAGISNVLVENKINFKYVTGISAGSSILVNYVIKDTIRTKKTFVDIAADKNFGGWKTFMSGKGYFNSDYIYEESSQPGQILEFDFQKLMATDIRFKIIAFDIESAQGREFTNEDVNSSDDIIKIVRASSSLPIFMKPTHYQGRDFYDGGLTGGIAIENAINDGYEKFFIVRTRPRGYRKEKPKRTKLLKKHYRNYPKVYQALITRYENYNRQCDLIDKLEKEGKAYVVYPDDMKINQRELDLFKLENTYKEAFYQGQKELDKWIEFIKNNK